MTRADAITAEEASARLEALRSVVAFGGGTGLGRLLSALSFLGSGLVGVVSTTDDGGSTGRLRQDAGCIAWGDLRNCLNQICIEPTLERLLFEYRFRDAGALSGHNLGNLMLLALDQLTARPLDAVNLVRAFLKVEPALLPMSEEPAVLHARDLGGAVVAGETNVAAMAELPQQLWLAPDVAATPEVLEAIKGAELITFGPGSFVTSVLPALLLPEIRGAVQAARCPKVLVANLSEEPGPVGLLSLRSQLLWMERVLGVQLVNGVLWPTERAGAPQARLGGSLAEVVWHRCPLRAADGRHERERLVRGLVALLDEQDGVSDGVSDGVPDDVSDGVSDGGRA